MKHDELSIQDEMLKADDEKELRFGATRTVGDALMGQILEEYLRKYPEAKIHMEVDNTRDLLQRLDQGEIDFALVEGFFKKSEYESQVYSVENYIAVCSPDYQFNEDPVSVENLFREKTPFKRVRIRYKRGAGTLPELKESEYGGLPEGNGSGESSDD